MKTMLRTTILFSMIAAVVIILSYCRKDDQIILPGDPANPSALISQKVSTAPVLDGVIDAMWANFPKLEFQTVVPDPSGDLFRGYVGNVIPYAAIRSCYDANNIYFLMEWTDPTESLVREPWYFDPVAKLWKKESGAPIFTSPTRGAFYEDKVAMLFNVDKSVSGWNAATCYKSCHTGLSAADGYGRHFTNNSQERIDMWHWKSVRGGIAVNQWDDQYQDNSYPNGRKSDAGGGGYTNNTQKLAVTGSNPAVNVDVPKYVIPNRTGYNWILGTEITDGTAKLVTAVSDQGILTLSDGTMIDPNTDLDFQRAGAGVGSQAIPYILISPYEGSHGDITCRAVYTGTGWILETQRALKTGDTLRQDVDFSSLEDQPFGFAIFENAQIAHGLKPNLLLKFQK